MKKHHKPKKHILTPLSFYPLNVEDALAAFMRVDLTPVREAMRRLLQRRGKAAALLTG